MSNGTGRFKNNLAIVVSLAVLIGSAFGWIGTIKTAASRDAILREQVRVLQEDYNELHGEWKAYDSGVVVYRLDKMEGKLDEILILLK